MTEKPMGLVALLHNLESYAKRYEVQLGTQYRSYWLNVRDMVINVYMDGQYYNRPISDNDLIMILESPDRFYETRYKNNR